jgi:sulfate permease, SulP family
MSATTTPAAPRNPWVGDLWGGFAAMLVVLPSSVAFGVAIFSPLGAEAAARGATAGLIGAVVLGLLAPPLGGAPRLVTAPCAPAAAVMALLGADLLAHGATPERVVLLMTIVALLSGALQFVYGAVGAGRLIKFIPYPVVSGYLSGVGLLILLKQLPGLLGLPHGVSVWHGLMSPGSWSVWALVVGAATIVAVPLAPRLIKAVPPMILGVAAGVLAYLLLGFVHPALRSLDHNPLVIGRVGGAGTSVWGALVERWGAVTSVRAADLGALIVPALTLSVLLSIDTLKTCVIVDALTRSRHRSNRELCAQGVGNLGSALLGGVPGAGQMGATLVNVGSGGTTRRSGLLVGVFALLATLLLGQLIAWVPMAALAGVLCVVAFRMFDRKSLRLLRQRSTLLDFAVIAAVIVTAVTVSLIAASGVGLVLAILLFMRDQIRGSVIRRKVHGGQVFSKVRRLPAQIEALERHGAETVICELQGDLFFGTTDQLLTDLAEDLKQARYVILDTRRVQSIDYTAANMLGQVEGTLAERGGQLVLCALPKSVRTGQSLEVYLAELGLVRPWRSVKVLPDLDAALEWVEDRVLEAQGLLAGDVDPPLPLTRIELVREFDDAALAALSECLVERSCGPGERIFAQGDVGDEIFLMRRGAVRIEFKLDGGKAYHLASFGRGDFFGDMAFLDRGTRSADAVATAATDVYVLSRARFDRMALNHPDMAVKVFARIARALAMRLRRADAELRALHEA